MTRLCCFTRTPLASIMVLALFTPLLMLLSLMLGSSQLSPTDMLSALLNGTVEGLVIHEYRLPRTLLAALTGAGLGLSGALVQGVIRNPLASPDLMGISAGAGLAATAMLVLAPEVSLNWLPVAAIVGGCGAALLILLAARHAPPSTARLALIGIAISAFLSSAIDFLLVLKPIQLNSALIWLTGSLWGRSWEQVPLLGIAWLVLIPMALRLAWRLDVMALGRPGATALGIQPQRVQWLALLLAVMLASLSVAVAGTLSFVGLLAPHLARLLCGGRHAYLLPATLLCGALLVLVADLLARTLAPPLELPAGIITALIGAPYFIFLLLRYRGW